MKNRYLLLLIRLAALSVLMAAAAVQASAQRPTSLNFPDTPCDSIFCSSLYIANTSIIPEDVIGVRIRDSVNYTVAPGFILPRTVLPGDSIAIPVCFKPSRRGRIVDSMVVMLTTAAGPDSASVRLTGRGVGPSLQVEPIVLNFPKTNVLATSMLPMTIRNTGELPYDLTAGKLNIPPPFHLQTVLPITIPPGDSVVLQFTFEPQETGVFSVAVDLDVNCGVSLQLGFNGVTELIGTGAVLRLTKVGFNPANNEQTPCDITRCTDVTLNNVGNAPLIIEEIRWDQGGNGFTITSNPPTPFIIAPNTQRVIEVCAGSSQRRLLQDTLIVTSNSRSSIAFGMVIDVSGSMHLNMKCGADNTQRIDQAIVQANNFINRTLLFIPSIGIQDQLAINSYSSALIGTLLRINFIFPLTYITDATRAQAQASVAGLTADGGTPTGAALKRMIDTLSKSPLRNRVIVLLTDGEADATDQQKHPVQSIIDQANRYDIRIFAIGVGLSFNGSGGNYLRRIAQGTGGVAFDAGDNDCQTLQSAFEAITDSVSRGAKLYSPFALKVISPSIVATSSIRFDSVYVHGTACSTLSLTNIGEGEAIVDDIKLQTLTGAATSEFYLPPSIVLPLRIPEGEQIELPICFTAEAIRMRYGQAFFRYNNCGGASASTQFSGAAYAVTNLRLTDQRIGLPNDMVTLPVYVDSSLADYGVNKIDYEIRWNSTMLDLRTLRPGPAAGSASVALDGPVTYNGNEAVARITVSGAQAPGAGKLADLDFLVLRGNALSSDIELKQGMFQDDNPRRILVNKGVVGFDSTCFRDAKPVSPNGATKIVVGDAGPNPATAGSATIPVSADGAMMIALELYGVDGGLVRGSELYDLDDGSGSLKVDLTGLASGSYYAILKSSTGETFLRKILVAR